MAAPGSFKLKDGTTLRQAISLAQGTTFKARLADAVILFVGLDQTIEREGNDRKNLTLPAIQLRLFEALMAVGKPVVVVGDLPEGRQRAQI